MRSRWATYTTRYWVCSTCGRTGFILQHREDTPPKAIERRLLAHGVRQHSCMGEGLRWTTAEEDAAQRIVSRAGLPPLE